MIIAKEILSSALEVSATSIPDDAAMDTFQPWDSLGHMRVIAGVEERLGRPLQTEEMLSIIDLRSLTAVLGEAA